MKVRAGFLLICLFLSGCATYYTSDQVRAFNRNNLMKLSVGMTKQQVLDTMGVGTYQTMETEWIKDAVINNPYKSEVFRIANKTYEVLFYCTDSKDANSAVSDNELTPILIENNSVIGWGWPLLNSFYANKPTSNN